jgi:hypothetical protein
VFGTASSSSVMMADGLTAVPMVAPPMLKAAIAGK